MTFGMLLELLITKLGEPPGRKTVLYPPRFEMARIGLFLDPDVFSAVSAAETSGFSAK
jgi:hypothetical protein